MHRMINTAHTIIKLIFYLIISLSKLLNNTQTTSYSVLNMQIGRSRLVACKYTCQLCLMLSRRWGPWSTLSKRVAGSVGFIRRSIWLTTGSVKHAIKQTPQNKPSVCWESVELSPRFTPLPLWQIRQQGTHTLGDKLSCGYHAQACMHTSGTQQWGFKWSSFVTCRWAECHAGVNAGAQTSPKEHFAGHCTIWFGPITASQLGGKVCKLP